jgi:hypothetical protein
MEQAYADNLIQEALLMPEYIRARIAEKLIASFHGQP